MKRLLPLLCIGLAATALAVDISPSRRTVPEKFTNPPGKRFSIFGGDPERVQKANEINVQDFEGKIEIANKDISLAEIKLNADRRPSLNITFSIHNKGNRSYTLSFPDAQRYDLMIKNDKDEIIYVWSDDKVFVKEIGKTFVNKNETITYTINPPIDLSTLLYRLTSGATYKVTAVLCNYPEVQGSSTFTAKP